MCHHLAPPSSDKPPSLPSSVPVCDPFGSYGREREEAIKIPAREKRDSARSARKLCLSRSVVWLSLFFRARGVKRDIGRAEATKIERVERGVENGNSQSFLQFCTPRTILQLPHLQRLLPGGRMALVWIKVLLFLVSSVCFWICEAAEWAGECTSALRMLGIVRTCAQL